MVLKQKENLTISFEETKKDSDAYKITYKGKSLMISFENDEFQVLKKMMNVLDSNFKACAFNKTKIESFFKKGIHCILITQNILTKHNAPKIHIKHNIFIIMLSCMLKFSLVPIVIEMVI